MAVFDDPRLDRMLELRPFSDWLNPTEYGRVTLVTPESTFEVSERVEGGVVTKTMQVQSEVTLEKGLQVHGRDMFGGEFKVSGLIPGGIGHSPVWEMSAETKEVVDANRKEYKRLTDDTIPSDVKAILHEQSRMRKEGGGQPVWEIDASFTQDELVRLGLAKKKTTVQQVGEEFTPDPAQSGGGGFRGTQTKTTTTTYDNQKEVQEVAEKLKHESVNVYGEMGCYAPYLSPTWWMFLEELKDAMEEFKEIHAAQESLETTLFERLSLRPGADLEGGDEEFMMGARYELPVYGTEIMFDEAKLPQVDDPLAWIDFLAGFPYGCCEMLLLAGEVTTKKEDWPSYPDEDMPVPPVPTEFFDEKYTEKRTPHDLLWLASDRVDTFATGLASEKTPPVPNWWLRVNFKGDEKHPYPGEFLGLGVRLFPNLTWGTQRNSPFLYGGHWIDTAFITSGSATIVEKTSGGYYLCKLDWRKQKDMEVYPSDFAEYEVGDRVTVLKDIKTEKTSQLWKDEDCFTPDKEVWRIVPLTYYGYGFDQQVEEA